MPAYQSGGGYGNNYQSQGYQGGGGRSGGYQGYSQGGGGGYSQQQSGYQGGGYQGGRSGGYQGYSQNGNSGGYSQSGYSQGQGSGYQGSNYQGGRSGGYQGRGGGGWNSGDRGSTYGAVAPHVNSMGFHGDERPDQRTEDRLFHKGDAQVAGINFDKYDDIPVEVSNGCPAPYDVFTEETMGTQLFRNLALSTFTKPTPVQKYSIPIGLMGADLMACAQTGSGKTGGFLFPVIATLLRKGALPDPETSRSKTSYPSALILAPTRELASQIFDEAQKFTYCTGIRPVVVYGGASVQDQQRELDRGVDLLVATPGRLVDLIERGRIRLDLIQFLILDEADRM